MFTDTLNSNLADYTYPIPFHDYADQLLLNIECAMVLIASEHPLMAQPNSAISTAFEILNKSHKRLSNEII